MINGRPDDTGPLASPPRDPPTDPVSAGGDGRASPPAARRSTVPLFGVGAWLWASLAAALAALTAATGLLLMAFYRPTAAGAAPSLHDLRHLHDLGPWRDAHYWLGTALLIAAWLHLLRVYMAGSYRRLLGWSMTVLLVVLVVALAWTGSLLTTDPGTWSAGAGHPSVEAPAAVVQRLPSDPALQQLYFAHCVGLPLLGSGMVAVWWRRRRRRDAAR